MDVGLDRLRDALVTRYTIERQLGQGGMSTVYLARDVRHDRQVAVKVLKPELAAVIGAERFLQEIRVTAHLQHPHILPLFDSGEADSFLFYVMPYLEGESLRERLTREKQLPVDEAIEITREAASALDYAHRHKVIHRDIKPENILLEDGQTVVADFGIALAVTEAGGNRLTETGLSLGTPQYMSPEQATADRELDARSDIYSLACVLYEMLTGEPPYTGNTVQAIIAKVLTDQPRRLCLSRSSVPAHVETAVHRALAKLPADRFATALQFADALTRPAAVPASAAPATLVAGPAAAPPLRRPWQYGFLAGVAALALLTGVLVDRRLGRTPTPHAPVTRLQVALPAGEQLATYNGGDVTLSPDGSQLGIVTVGERGRQIYLRALDELEARPFGSAATGGLVSPFFSPDGRWMAYYQPNGNRLLKSPVTGGRPTPIGQIPAYAQGGSWGENDQIVVGSAAGLVALPASGGVPRPMTRADPGESHSWPEVLPGGKAVIFTIMSGPLASRNARLAVAELASGKTTVLDLAGTYPRYAAPGYLLYVTADASLQAVPFDAVRFRVTGTPVALAQGVLVLNSGAADFTVAGGRVLVYVLGSARRRLMLVDRSGAAHLLTEQQEEYTSPAFSPDGLRVALQIGNLYPSDIWVVTLGSRTMSRITLGGLNMYPAWSPNGRRLLFTSDRVGHVQRLYTTAADGSGGAQLLFSGKGPVWEGTWLPDGRSLVYRDAAPNTNRDIWYRPQRGDTTPQPVATTTFDERMPAVSPDGHWVAYVSDESGRDEVYVRPLPPQGGGRWQVSPDGGTQPVWARSARELFYIHGTNLFVASIRTTPTFSVGDRRLLVTGDVFQMGQNQHTNFDVSPDGGRFVMVGSGSGESPRIVAVVNWLEELKARARAQAPLP
jgi:serine/threonine-protein kinase